MASDASVCARCLDVHALPSAVENLYDGRGIDIYDLPLYADAPTVPLEWNTITAETQFAAAYAYLQTVALQYMIDGMCECYCAK